jgi:predicted lipoprotein with Yx(FWY)xxD motif
MKTRLIIPTVVALLAVSACGSDDASTTPASAPAPAATAAPVEQAAAPTDAAYGEQAPAPTDAADDETSAPAGDLLVSVGSTDIGDVLVDANELTLYGFTPDVDRTPTCFEACAAAWPPIMVDGPDLPAGLDPALFSVVERDGEGHQLAAGKWPLYTFAGDAAPGDVNGQASGGNWFAVAPDGSLIDA